MHYLTRGSLSTTIVQEIPARWGATDSVPNGAKLHTGCRCQAAESPGDGGGQGGGAAVGVQSLQRASPGAAFQACHDDAAGCLPAAGPPSGGCFVVVLKGGCGGGGGLCCCQHMQPTTSVTSEHRRQACPVKMCTLYCAILNKRSF